MTLVVKVRFAEVCWWFNLLHTRREIHVTDMTFWQFAMKLPTETTIKGKEWFSDFLSGNYFLIFFTFTLSLTTVKSCPGISQPAPHRRPCVKRCKLKTLLVLVSLVYWRQPPDIHWPFPGIERYSILCRPMSFELKLFAMNSIEYLSLLACGVSLLFVNSIVLYKVVE